MQRTASPMLSAFLVATSLGCSDSGSPGEPAGGPDATSDEPMTPGGQPDEEPAEIVCPRPITSGAGIERVHAITADADHVYWAQLDDYTSSSIRRVARTGGEVEILVAGYPKIWETLLVDDDHLWFATDGDGWSTSYSHGLYRVP